MPIFTRHARLWIIGLTSIAMYGCGPAPDDDDSYSDRRATTTGALVGPLENDESDDIVSWVDGQVVTDWAAEIQKRQQAIDGYLSDTDPARADEYGFRSGQHPELAWRWFSDNPIGFGGVPYVLFKTILDLDPNHENETLRAIARIWKREAIVPPDGASDAVWTVDHIGFGPHPDDYVDGVARPPSERQWPLPYGFVFENPETFEPLSAAETLVLRRSPAGTPHPPEHHPPDCEDPCRRYRGELGAGSTDVRETDRTRSRFLLVRGMPRGSGHGVRRDDILARDAQHGGRGPVLLEAADADRRGPCRIGL